MYDSPKYEVVIFLLCREMTLCREGVLFKAAPPPWVSYFILDTQTERALYSLHRKAVFVNVRLQNGGVYEMEKHKQIKTD